MASGLGWNTKVIGTGEGVSVCDGLGAIGAVLEYLMAKLYNFRQLQRHLRCGYQTCSIRCYSTAIDNKL